MAKFLDQAGVQHLWSKIKNSFVAKDGNKVLSTNDFTTAYKEQLDNLTDTISNATVDHAESAGYADTASHADTAGNAYKVNNLTVETAVPENAVFTDTTYSAATDNADGLMSKEHHIMIGNHEVRIFANETMLSNQGVQLTENTNKLSGIADGAQVNTIETIKIGESNIVGDTTKVADATEAINTLISTAITGVTQISFNTDYDTLDKLLDATGKVGVIYLVPNDEDTNNVFDEYIWANNEFELLGTTEVDLSAYAKTADIPSVKVNNAVNADTVNGLTVETAVPADAVFTDTTYVPATANADGLMPAADFTKLAGIATGATADEALTNGELDAILV